MSHPLKKYSCPLIFIALFLFSTISHATQQIPITIEAHIANAPITLGIPFPKGELYSPDRVRVLTPKGKEIPSQITEVATWQPADASIKWIWVFFFAEQGNDYVLEYGEDVHRMAIKNPIVSENNMRPTGYLEANTGVMKLDLKKGKTGFLSNVWLDMDGDKFFDDTEQIATGIPDRGSFLDILDDLGVDKSKAVIHNTFREKGSGPLHVIFRVEGEYIYERSDNNASPFTMYIHAYAGKSYIRVLHTLTYTGIPDKHKVQEGEHANIATQSKKIVSEETADDPGWTQPNDQIQSTGLQLKYNFGKNVKTRSAYIQGDWFENSPLHFFEETDVSGQLSLQQMGPDANRMPPVEESSLTERLDGFYSIFKNEKKTFFKNKQAAGWIDIADDRWGVAVGIKHFLKEYPKEITVNIADSTLTAYIWSPNAEPMSFARWSTDKDGGMIDNFAQGLTKTTELIYHFHKADETTENIQQTMDYVLRPPVPHAAPEAYAKSEVYGKFAPRTKQFADFERGLEYKYKWWLFNQNWVPWYGMFDYGDGKTYYNEAEGKWYVWTNNEPATDFMFWMQFMRTGDPMYYHAGEALSRHTMDVDNIHWPTKPKYIGHDNDAIAWWKHEKLPAGTPYLGIGRRHANQHWVSLLSAHVWVQGWLAEYYLTGYHRALDVAKLTGDSYCNRIWGEHDLRGRRLYLSVQNLVEIYDATKDERYLAELKDRVDIMLQLQAEQGGNLLLDRYGYSQPYVSHGLYKYWQLTSDEQVKKALVTHARWVRDVPPLNHQMESYLATIHPLLVGYELSGEPTLLATAIKRAEVLKTNKLPKDFEEYTTQKELADILESVSNLPPNPKSSRTIWKMTHGIRVFGWTHANNVAWLLYWLDRE